MEVTDNQPVKAMNSKEPPGPRARGATRFQRKPTLKDELRRVLAKLQEESEQLLERDFPRGEWTQTQFFRAIKRTCKDLRQAEEAESPWAPARPPANLDIEALVSHLEADRAALHRHVKVLEIVRDQLWELLMQNRKDKEQLGAEARHAAEALRFYARPANWQAPPAPPPAVRDQGERARGALARLAAKVPGLGD
jgi:hypothetical protein